MGDFVGDAGVVIVYTECWYDPRFIVPDGEHFYLLASQREDGLRVIPGVFVWLPDQRGWELYNQPARFLPAEDVARWAAVPMMLTQNY